MDSKARERRGKNLNISSGTRKRKSETSAQPHRKQLRLVMVRHGETLANKHGIVQGQTDGKLSPLGCQQAKLVGHRLAQQRWDAIYCSDLARARATVAEVYEAAADPEHPVSPLPKLLPLPILRERSAGELEGAPGGSIERGARQAGVPSREFRPAGGGESSEDVRARAGKFLLWLVEQHLVGNGVPKAAEKEDGQAPGKENEQRSELPHRRRKKKGRTLSTRVLAVTHGGFIKEFVHVTLAYEKPAQSANHENTASKQEVPQQTARSLSVSRGSLANLHLQTPPVTADTWSKPSSPQTSALTSKPPAAAPPGELVGQLKPVEVSGEAGKPEVNGGWSSGDERVLQAQRKVPEPQNCQQMAHGVEVGRWAAASAPTTYKMHPVRPKNAAVYEFSITLTDGKGSCSAEGGQVDQRPKFVVRMVKDNDISHLNQMTTIPPAAEQHASPEKSQMVMWESPLAKLLAL